MLIIKQAFAPGSVPVLAPEISQLVRRTKTDDEVPQADPLGAIVARENNKRKNRQIF